jgi:hypothetical protein
MRGFLLSFVFIFIASRGDADIWRVSPKLLPALLRPHQYQTIQEAATNAAPGDVVVIESGIYRETVVVSQSGTREKPIRFEAAPGANVFVTGLDRLTKWQNEGGKNAYSTNWPYRFIPWSKYEAHPDDEYHRLIGRAEQVVMNGNLLQQTLQLDQISPGAFYVDLEKKRLCVCPAGRQDLRSKSVQVEAATRSLLWECKGNYINLRGLHFRYSANPAQKGAVVFEGRGDIAEDCSFERMNGSGAAFLGPDQIARRCIFQNNGQLGFSANGGHNLLITGCTIRNNNIKGFSKQWEAGGTKVVLSRNVVFEKCRVIGNHGPGIWFDIGDENCTVRNCLIADNEDAGIFYEISYGLNAHDNVAVGNGFAYDPDAWGGQAGIVLSSSPNCVVTRNLLVGNREGFNFREQPRTTGRIDNADGKHDEAVWNHNEQICNNTIAYNRDAQTRGWFDVTDQRYWPNKMQTPAATMSLETLGIVMAQNIYACEENQPLFIWGTNWRRHQNYQAINPIQSELNLENGSQLTTLKFSDPHKNDFRLPRQSAPFEMKCYPAGDVPDVRLGKAEN